MNPVENGGVTKNSRKWWGIMDNDCETNIVGINGELWIITG